MPNPRRTMGILTGAQVLARARSAIGHRTIYDLGAGGRDPFAPLPGNPGCDCSGFAAWDCGVDRFLDNAGIPHLEGAAWFETTAVVKDAVARGVGWCDEVRWQHARPGDLIVWPDRNVGGEKRQGHIGIVGSIGPMGPETVVHCSAGNYRRTGDAIQETPVEIFLINHAIIARPAWVREDLTA